MSTSTVTSAAAALAAALALALAGCGGPSEPELVASARTLLAKKDYKAALVQLKSALQQNPQSGEARYLLGSTLLGNGDTAAALIELEKARDLGADRNQLLPVLARAMNATGQLKKVTDLYSETTLSDPKAAAELKAQVAWAFLRLGMIDRSESQVAAGLQLDPKNDAVRLQKAILAARRGKFDDALAQVSALIAENPKQVDALLLEAELLWGAKSDLDGATAAYRRALVIDPQRLAAHVGLLNLMEQKGDLAGFRAQVAELKKALPDSLDARFYDTELALLENDLIRARSGAQFLLRIAPDSARVLHLAGSVELQTGAVSQARIHLTRAIQLRPDLLSLRRMLAVAMLRSGQPTDALAALKPLLDEPKPKANVLEVAAQAYLQSGDLPSAQALYKRAAQADPGDMHARVAFAVTQIATGEEDAGLGALRTLASEDKGTSADLALLTAHLGRRDMDSALKDLERIEAKTPKDPMAHLIRGRVLYFRHDLAGARASFEKALGMDPNYFPAVAELASMDLADGKADQARKRYEELLAREPKNYHAMLALADLRQRSGAKPEEVVPLVVDAIKANPFDPAARLQLIQLRMARYQAKEAVAAAQDAVAAMPDDLLLQDALGRAQLAAGDQQQAMITFRKIAGSNAKAPEPYLRLAQVYARLKRYDEAVDAINSALAVAPQLLSAQRALIEVELARKRVPAALGVVRQVQKQRPGEAVGFVLEAGIYAGQKAWDPAIAAARAALERERSTAVAILVHGLYLAAGRGADAQQFAATWRRQRPDDLDFVFHLGSLALDRKDYPAAEALYRQVLAARPDEALTINNVAWLLILQGKPGAVALAERANKLAPGRASFTDTLAQALRADKQPQAALEWARKTVALAPEEPKYRLNLARLLIETGDRAQARTELQTLAALGGGFDRQAEVASLLGSL